MRNATLKNQIKQNLNSKIAYGESKHQDKQGLEFGQSTYKIYSFDTKDTYEKACLRFEKWLVEEKQISKRESLEEVEKYVKEYLQHRLDDNKSVYTVKMERSALSMLYAKQFDIDMPKRDNKNITRSREETANDKHHSESGIYRDLFVIAKATGGRRCDLEKVTKSAFYEKDGKMYVNFLQSKGGRDRTAIVREEYQQQVKEILQKHNDKDKLFPHIPKEIDIHALRRNYAQNLYQDIKENRELRDNLLKLYPERHEYKTQKDKDGNTYTKEIEKTTYTDRDKNTYLRDDVYVVTQCLGHNRIDVTITHYLKA